MAQRWSPEEEEILFRLVCHHWLTIKAIPNRRLTDQTPVVQEIHSQFVRKFGNQRDRQALLYKLGSFRHGGGTGIQFGNYNPTTEALDINKQSLKSSTPRTFDWGPKHLFNAVRKEVKQTILNTFEAIISAGESDVRKISEQIAETIKHDYPRLKKPHTPLVIVRFLLTHGKLVIDNHGCYALPPCGSAILSDHQRFAQQIEQHTVPDTARQTINEQRTVLGSHFSVHQRSGAAISFSSEGTGSGKSFQVNETYTAYLSRLADDLEARGLTVPGRNFCNQLFLAPQKNQLDIANDQVKRIERAGGELICVLSQKDIPDLGMLNWFTDETNEQRYQRWIDVVKKKNPYIGGALAELERAIKLVKHNEQEEKCLRFSQDPLAAFQLESVKQMLKMSRYRISNAIKQAAYNLVSGHEEEHGDETLWFLIQKGRQARKKRLLDNGKHTTYEIYLEILGQVIPFNLCTKVPCLLFMTTQKFDTNSSYVSFNEKTQRHAWSELPFDQLVGGKRKLKNPKVGSHAKQTFSQQVTYLAKEHYPIDEESPFRRRNIRFNVVIDEEHESYGRLMTKCTHSLITEDTNLSHVLSVVCRCYVATQARSHDLTNFDQEQRQFVDKFTELLSEHCLLSDWVTIDPLLRMFTSQMGAFEVEGDQAERIVQITRNVFSFNPKLFLNQEGLKKLRMRTINEERTLIYFHKEGDTSDTNPTLYDLFQLLSAILGACAEVSDRDFLNYLRDGGHPEASGQNQVLSQFLDATKKSVAEINQAYYIFDQVDDPDLDIDYFYTYIQPKIVFSMVPVNKLSYFNEGGEDSIILAFTMNLITELPESTILRMLTGTENQVITLSATRGYAHTQNGNFSKTFLTRMSEPLGFEVRDRSHAELPDLKKLREMRATNRKITVAHFDAERESLERPETGCRDFHRVKDTFIKALLDTENMKYRKNIRYHRRQLHREVEALLLASWDSKNTLTLSLSNDFASAFKSAASANHQQWLADYQLQCKDEEGRKIWHLKPFPQGAALCLVLFDADLGKRVDVLEKTRIETSGMRLVMMSSYTSAGTGLNYYVHYCQRNDNDEIEREVQLDFERLVLINSPFYSEVRSKGCSLNTLDNHLTIMKHMADDDKLHYLRDLENDFGQGESRRLLDHEHEMSLYKTIKQAVGRTERRDARMETEILMPDSVFRMMAARFAVLSDNPANDIVLGSMSMLNHAIRQECETYLNTHSFSNDSDRKDFETTSRKNSLLIDKVHKATFSGGWDARVRQGDMRYLEPCELFRSKQSFTDPAAWIKTLSNNERVSADRKMSKIIDKMFIPRTYGGKAIILSHKRDERGLRSSDRHALSDIVGGADLYCPEKVIFPQYTDNMRFDEGDPLRKMFQELKTIEKKAFEQWVPLPALIPLLRGNVGEWIVHYLLGELGIDVMEHEQTFALLNHDVYELYDCYLLAGDTLIALDVKNWSTRIDNLHLSEETVAKASGKRKVISDTLAAGKQREDELEAIAKVAGIRQCRFIYLNTNYAQNDYHLMSESTDCGDVHYLNLFIGNMTYKQIDQSKRGHRSSLDNHLKINPLLKTLLKA